MLLSACGGGDPVPTESPPPPVTNPPPDPPPPPPPPPPANQAPIASIAPQAAVDEGAGVVLDGSASRDPENGALSFRWEQLAGPAAALDSPSAARPRLVAPEIADDETLRFRLTVTDAAGAQAIAELAFAVRDVAKNLSALVDPRIGSFPPGFINPGPVAPFGMVNVGPDTEGPLNYGGYSVQNLLLSGFSHVHMSAGVPKGGQVPVMPFTGELTPGDLSQLGWPNPVPAYASPFNRLTEVAQVGYYAADLPRYDVSAELTATTRAALHRYTFAGASGRQLLFDVGRDLAGTQPAHVRLDGDVLRGWAESGDAGGYRVYFAARFDTPFSATAKDGAALPAEGEGVGAILAFEDGSAPLLAKVGISYVDEASALANLDAEIPGWDFDAVRAQNVAAWDAQLARIAVTGGSAAERSSFYSALYRAQQFPNLLSDVDGRYPGPDKQVHQDTRPHYTQFSLWDSYRGQNQLLAELVPERYEDMLASLLDFHRQGGALPRWQQAGGDASHMSGDPVIPFIADGLCRGLGQAHAPALLGAMKALAARRDPQLDALGYLATPAPANPLEQIEGGPSRAGTTLEYGIADFALALVAQAQGDADAAAVAQRSLNYRNLLDAESGWIRPRDETGAWLTPFRPELGYGFQEGTSWQYSWLAMHDLAGLYERMGGEATVNQRLDQFFLYPASLVPLAVPTIQNQITVFGVAYYGNQYAPGNEHDLQAPYLYTYAGAPWKTAAVARAAASIYTPTPNGLPGNDDLGALSGWLAWTMMGLYPMNPGAPLMIAGSPHFESVRMRRPTGDLRIRAPGASSINRFVTGLSVDGAPRDAAWLVLPRGPTAIDFTTAAVPDMAWGADTRPPSLSTHELSDFGCLHE